MQMNLNISVELPREAYDYGTRASGGAHGVVLTKPHIVDLLLDLGGYSVDGDLTCKRLLEPACGHGAFLVPAIQRLLVAATREGKAAASLKDAVVAFDIDPEHVRRTRESVLGVLRAFGASQHAATLLAQTWVRQGDFLLASINERFDLIVGNPPYVRIEQLTPALHNAYRHRYRALYDRADLYVAFIERGLSLLAEEGALAFICADRWISNKYGAPLREIVTSRHQVRCYVDLHRASPFESDVIAYPSVFVLGKGTSSNVPVVRLKTGSVEECAAVPRAVRGETSGLPAGVSVATYPSWFRGDEPWVLSSPTHLNALRAMEANLLPLSATCRVGIGVATGNDRVYITRRDADIEPDRLVPLVMRDDIKDGRLEDAGRAVIHVFDEAGRVVDLDRYPRLRSYLAAHEDEIKKRHVAQKNPRAWFRTIDRVYPELVSVPKLLIPDIAGSNEVAFDEGRFHPHHNLYFVTSEQWDMEVLGGLLSSKVALFFIWSYAVKMRGSYLRFQAQYLRRIRLPDPATLPVKLASRLKVAFKRRDFKRLDELAMEAYGLEELPDFDFVDTRR
ncbi:MAG: Eco57I restriction-modification methylase domain-containing protein [Polyangiaceae bacterium]